MFITKVSLSRRTVLRGMGISLALPLLEAMVPALTATAQTAANPRRRFGAVFVPHGERPSYWTPTKIGADFELTPILKPLEPFRDSLTVVSELCTPADGHGTTVAAWLTGSVPKKTDGRRRPGREVGRSGDRVADRIEYGVSRRSNSRPRTSRATSAVRRVLRLRLHEHAVVAHSDGTAADGNQSAHALRADVRRWSDQPHARSSGCSRIAASSIRWPSRSRDCQLGLGTRDRQRLSDYLEDIREIERRIQRAEKQATTEVSLPGAPIGIPEAFEEHATLQFDLLALAYATDLTRVFTFMMSRDTSQRVYPNARHHGAAPLAVASRQQAGKHRRSRQAEHVSGRAVRQVPEEAAGHAGRRWIAP